jgi:AP-2 complex subunit mu-1
MLFSLLLLRNMLFRIPRFQGQSEFTLTGEANLTAMTHKKTWSRPPISMDFQVLMFTSSGLLVRFLKVFEKSNYNSVKWVRYMTKAGNYQIRVRGRSLGGGRTFCSTFSVP